MSDSLPDWVPFDDLETYRAFLAVVHRVLESQGREHTISDGLVVMAEPDGGEHQLGLRNLAQVCHQLDESDWPQIVARHFQQMLDGEDGRLVAEYGTDFEFAAPKLRLRLYARDAMEDLPAVGFEVSDDLWAAVVLDMPDTVCTVTTDMRAAWRMTDRELFQMARQNVLRHEAAEWGQVQVEGATIEVCAGDSFFTASHALSLAAHVELPPLGALVGVPSRHYLYVHRIRDLGVVKAINALLPQLRMRHVEGPGSISDQLYWWFEGELIRLPSELREGGMAFHPPRRFVETVLEKLAHEPSEN